MKIIAPELADGDRVPVDGFGGKTQLLVQEAKRKFTAAVHFSNNYRTHENTGPSVHRATATRQRGLPEAANNSKSHLTKLQVAKGMKIAGH